MNLLKILWLASTGGGEVSTPESPVPSGLGACPEGGEEAEEEEKLVQ